MGIRMFRQNHRVEREADPLGYNFVRVYTAACKSGVGGGGDEDHSDYQPEGRYW